MHIASLRLSQFRNYGLQEMQPHARLNILVGRNGQGKSNLLESIYLLSTTRSMRAVHDAELIRHGAETAQVKADLLRVARPDTLLEVEVTQTDRKIVKIDGVRKSRSIELFGQLATVCFSALDLGIVAGEPGRRRRYLNYEVAQLSPGYVIALSNYKKTLEQRNRLLKDLRLRFVHDSGLEAWDAQLVQHGSTLIARRAEFLKDLAPLADEVHRQLTNGGEGLTVEYQPHVVYGEAGIEQAFDQMLSLRRRDELHRGVTLVGPQRDDIMLRIGDMDARMYGSAGQQRTVALSLKLAQFKLMCNRLREPPVVLLDDVLSDLDDNRRQQLVQHVQQECQTFITCTNLRSFSAEMLAESQIFSVAAGVLTKQAAGVQAASRE